ASSDSRTFPAASARKLHTADRRPCFEYSTAMRTPRPPYAMHFTLRCVEFSGANAALDAGAVENATRDFLDGTLRRIEVGNSLSVEQRLSRAHLVLNLRRGCVAAARTSFVANLLQAFGLDREPEQPAQVWTQRSRQ